MMYKTLHRKLKIEKHEPTENQGAPDEWAKSKSDISKK